MKREEAIAYWKQRSEVLHNWLKENEYEGFLVEYVEAIDMAIEALSADRPTGEWIHQAIIIVQGEKPRHEWSCSICGLWGNPDMNYCPNCGADMRSEKEYLDKTFPEHEGGEWLDITDMMTREIE